MKRIYKERRLYFSNKCPKCSNKFGIKSWQIPGKIVCSFCDFMISTLKYNKIVSGQIEQDLEDHRRAESQSKAWWGDKI